MISLDMSGTYDFDETNVNHMKQQMGNYALGDILENSNFGVGYVGRSLTNLRGELSQRLGTHGKYKKFMASVSNTVKEVFEKECKNYHEFNPPDNDYHPATPEGTNLTCPYTQYH